MASYAESRPQDVNQAVEELCALEARLDRALKCVEEPLRDLRRQARARSGRRPGSADHSKYRLGSALIALGFDGSRDLELLGLLWHSDVALTWLARARREHGPAPLAMLVTLTLSDDARRQWCADWGAWVLWNRKRELYIAGVQSFLDSGKADDPRAAWRRKPPTDDQIELIDILCDLDCAEPPFDPTRGEAFDWIRERAGNPRYRSGPLLPEDWL